MTDTWPTPGAEAVILQPYDRGALKAEPVTVERVLKRDVVLSNGDRFSTRDLERRIGGAWGNSEYLVPPDDPRVAATRHAIRLRNRKAKAHTAYEDWRRGKATARDVADAFTRLADFEDGA